MWKAVTMALRTQNLPTKYWEHVLPDVLHSIRTLLCKATNCTPHKRMFSHQRRSSTGCSIPSFLSKPGPVLLRRYVRSSKDEPLVRYQNGRESTVSLRDLAPSSPTLATDLARDDSPLHREVIFKDSTVENSKSTISNEKKWPYINKDIEDLNKFNEQQSIIHIKDDDLNSDEKTEVPSPTENQPRRSMRVSKPPI